MFCPNCNKLLDLNERKYCTGCGEKLDPEMLKHQEQKGTSHLLPYGARFVPTEAEMNALCKGLVFGGVFGFVLGTILAKFSFLLHIGTSIGYGIIGIVPFALFFMYFVSKFSPEAKNFIARNFNFIKTDGYVYLAVDFLVMKFPFLMPDKKKKDKRKKPPI